MNKMKYRNSSLRLIEQFFDGTGVSVEEYVSDDYLQLLTNGTDHEEYELNILVEDGKLKIWREKRG